MCESITFCNALFRIPLIFWVEERKQNFDETELRVFFSRHFCLFSFYSMPLFLKGREKEGNGE